MLTRFIKRQLVIFSLASIIGMTAMAIGYLQVPMLLGIGHITVKLELPRSGGLYTFGNVTYRGVQIGKITDLQVYEAERVEATMSLRASPRIPEDLIAAVRSVSAVGEQYIDLQPLSQTEPYLADGSVIPASRTRLSAQVGPMLNSVSALVESFPKGRLSDLLDESFAAFNGAGYDLGALLDSASTLSKDLSETGTATRALIDDSVPLLDSQIQSANSLRAWTGNLAGITGQLVDRDPQLRTILDEGPGFADELSHLLTAIQPTIPVLLANLTSNSQIALTYNPSLEQVLVLLPPNIASTQAAQHTRNPTGLPLGDFTISVSDPPACTVGFLPPSMWRSPEDDTDIDTPDGLYCKLPQDSPIAVRGARNYPCIGKPGKRAPTVQICNSDQPFQPLAMRQHATGPYPFDPNLVGQGVAPDSRVDADERIYAPVGGTPMPTDVPASAVPAPVEPLPAEADRPPVADPDTLPAVPNNFSAQSGPDGPSAAVVRYDPGTGAYMAPNGQLQRQTDLNRVAAVPNSWQQLLPLS